VAALEQALDERPADEAGRTGDENVHVPNLLREASQKRATVCRCHADDLGTVAQVYVQGAFEPTAVVPGVVMTSRTVAMRLIAKGAPCERRALCPDYPPPVVDLDHARGRALAAFEQARRSRVR
jgi:hypothetical protein